MDATVARAKAEGDLPLVGYHDVRFGVGSILMACGGWLAKELNRGGCCRLQVAEFCAALEKPRRIILLVQAGAAVDATIATLASHLEAGDLIVDGGNEWFPNTVRRGKELAEKGILFMGMGVSGGEVRWSWLSCEVLLLETLRPVCGSCCPVQCSWHDGCLVAEPQWEVTLPLAWRICDFCCAAGGCAQRAVAHAGWSP